MPRKRKPDLPKGGRWTSAGRVTLQFTVEVDGETKRLSQHKILPSEPQSYATPAEAEEGRRRVEEYLALEVDREQTVKGFWDRWTDVDDWAWGAGKLMAPNRRPPTYPVYRARTRGFVELFADRPMASITEADVKTYMQRGGKLSQLTTISTFLKDAGEEGLRTGVSPAQKLARRAEQSMRQTRHDNPPPTPLQPAVDAMLAQAATDRYPLSLYAWLFCGTETGMRGAELDGMQWEYLSGDVYDIQWQLHARSRTLEIPKHGSRRKVVIPAAVLDVIEALRADSTSPYIFTNTFGQPWAHDSREKWWTRLKGQKQSLSDLVDGATIYQATRHHWASKALNVWGMTPYQASLLYGHKDGGKLLVETYAKPDHDMAMDAVRAAQAGRPISITARRRAA